MYIINKLSFLILLIGEHYGGRHVPIDKSFSVAKVL